MGYQGYADPAYAASLAEFGTPRELIRSGGSVLVRPVPARADIFDAIGPYPLFSCIDWGALEADVCELAEDLISLSLVADPFGSWTQGDLRSCFPDLMVPYKEHHVIELASRPAPHAHHRRNSRRALERVDVEFVPTPVDLLEDWTRLYRQLVSRHGISGIPAFSEAVFAKQLALPGLVAFRAVLEDETAGAILWLIRDDVAYYHLGAYSEAGYDAGASFALFATALEYLEQEGLAWASLGAGAGVSANADDGLTRFKRGWATETRTAYLCGRVLRPAEYLKLAASGGRSAASYFPAYRAGEFA